MNGKVRVQKRYEIELSEDELNTILSAFINRNQALLKNLNPDETETSSKTHEPNVTLLSKARKENMTLYEQFETLKRADRV